MSDAIRVNGNQLSWGSIVLKVDGDRYYGFTEISFGDKLERQYAWGMGKHQAPRGRSRGKYTPEPVKVKGPKSSVDAFLKALADRSPSGDSFGNVECEIVAQFAEANEPVLTVEANRCTVTSVVSSHSEGAEVLVDEIELMPMTIRRNGRVLFDDVDGSP